MNYWLLRLSFFTIFVSIFCSQQAYAACCNAGCCDCGCVSLQLERKLPAIVQEMNTVLQKNGIKNKIIQFGVADSDEIEIRNSRSLQKITPQSCHQECWECSSGTCCGIRCQ